MDLEVAGSSPVYHPDVASNTRCCTTTSYVLKSYQSNLRIFASLSLKLIYKKTTNSSLEVASVGGINFFPDRQSPTGDANKTQEVKTVGVMKIMGKSGHSTVTWDPAVEQLVKEAERIFKEQRQKGAAGFAIDVDKKTRRIDKFDPTAREIVMVPRIVGG